MFANKSFFKPILTALTLAACTLGGVHTVAVAQGGSGLVIFGNRDVDILSYYLDFGGIADNRDRYRLRIPKKKLTNGATRFVISYPDYFDGKFDTDKIEVRLNGKKDQSLPLKNVVWDEGTYYFYAQVDPAINTPGSQRVGAWILSINP